MTACWACWRADVSVGSGDCAFLWGMQNLQTLSLARTRLEHDSMAAVLANLTALTTLSLGWCAPPLLSHPECTEMGLVRCAWGMAQWLQCWATPNRLPNLSWHCALLFATPL